MKKCNPHSRAPGRKKKDLLPQVIKLAEQGFSSREIAAQMKLGKTTVADWLRRARRESAAGQAIDPAEAIRKRIEHCQEMSREILDAWRRSKTDKRVQFEEESGPLNDPAAAKKKTSLRTENRAGDPAYMSKMMEWENKIDVLEQRLAALEQRGVARSGPPPLANLSDDDLRRLTYDELENFSDDQLLIIETRLQAKSGPSDLPLLTNEQLDNMSDEELTALENRLREDIES